MPDAGHFDEAAMTLLHRVGGDQLIEKMTALFSVNAPSRLQAATDAVAAGDYVRGEAAAHSLKSSSGQMGAVRLQHVCETLEAAFGKGDIVSARSLLKEAKVELAAALEWMTQKRLAR